MCSEQDTSTRLGFIARPSKPHTKEFNMLKASNCVNNLAGTDRDEAVRIKVTKVTNPTLPSDSTQSVRIIVQDTQEKDNGI